MDPATLRLDSLSVRRYGSDVECWGFEAALSEVEDKIDLGVASQVENRRRLSGE
jgi:hypothetical protein